MLSELDLRFNRPILKILLLNISSSVSKSINNVLGTPHPGPIRPENTIRLYLLIIIRIVETFFFLNFIFYDFLSIFRDLYRNLMIFSLLGGPELRNWRPFTTVFSRISEPFIVTPVVIEITQQSNTFLNISIRPSFITR